MNSNLHGASGSCFDLLHLTCSKFLHIRLTSSNRSG